MACRGNCPFMAGRKSSGRCRKTSSDGLPRSMPARSNSCPVTTFSSPCTSPDATRSSMNSAVVRRVRSRRPAWRRRARQNLVTDVAQSKATDVLDGMSWREFELLVGEGFRLRGYQVVETGGGGADGGVDLVLTKPGKNGGEKFLVQCKQWRAFKVGVDVVRELYGVMAARGATGGFVVTSGRFTEAGDPYDCDCDCDGRGTAAQHASSRVRRHKAMRIGALRPVGQVVNVGVADDPCRDRTGDSATATRQSRAHALRHRGRTGARRKPRHKSVTPKTNRLTTCIANLLIFMAPRPGLEPGTYGLTVRRSTD